MFRFEELDATTRQYMLQEFRREWNSDPYVSQRLGQEGVEAFPSLMEAAIQSGNEVTLAQSLSEPRFWRPYGTSHRDGRPYQRRIDPTDAAESLAITEFNTWYVRALSGRLLEEGETECEVYRAAPARQPRRECLRHEGRRFPVQEIYDGHRARYWPPPGNRRALSIPLGTNCHHSIRRIRD